MKLSHIMKGLIFFMVVIVGLTGFMLMSHSENGRIIYIDDEAPDGGDGSAASPFNRIRLGIEAASNGDMVLVLDGEYRGVSNRDLNPLGKAITIISKNGPERCFIKCNEKGRGFYLLNGETSSTRIEGFTIEDGEADFGAGIYCVDTSPTIVNCIFETNHAVAMGGGIYCDGGDPQILQCKFIGNTAGDTWEIEGYGGGIYLSESQALIRDCEFTENIAWPYEDYYAYTGGGGGGIHCRNNSDSTIVDCTFTGNEARAGAGIASAVSQPVISNCLFFQNNTNIYAGYGGGISCRTKFATIRNCVFSENAARQGGAIAYTDCSGSATLRHCTMTHNTAGYSWSSDRQGGGLWVSGTNLAVSNCIIYDNNAYGIGDEVYLDRWLSEPSEVEFSFCDVLGGQTRIYLEPDCTLIWGTGMIDADPLLADAAGGNCLILPGSPCIDAGHPGFVPEPGETDFEGDLRVLDGDQNGSQIVDMGADEFGAFTQNNAGVVAIHFPPGVQRPGDFTISADVKNFGTLDQDSIPVVCEIYKDNTEISHTVSSRPDGMSFQQTGRLAARDEKINLVYSERCIISAQIFRTALAEFTPHWHIGKPGRYAIHIESRLPGDEDRSNDDRQTIATIQPYHDVGVDAVNSPTGDIPPGFHTVNATLSNAGSYQDDVPVNCRIVDRTHYMKHDFMSSSSFLEWTWEEDHEWSRFGGNKAGGTSPELYTGGSHIQGNYTYIDSPPADTTEAGVLLFEFKTFIANRYGDLPFDCRVYTRGADIDPWTEITPWVNPITADFGPETFVLDITAISLGTGSQVRFEFSGVADYLWGWHIDDVIFWRGTAGTQVFEGHETIPIEALTVTDVDFHPSWRALTGIYEITVSTGLADDENPDNNEITSTVTVQ